MEYTRHPNYFAEWMEWTGIGWDDYRSNTFLACTSWRRIFY